MGATKWQKQHIRFQGIVWVVSAVIALMLIMLMLLLGFGLEVAGVFFIVVFVIMRIALAYIFKNRYGNSLVRILKFDYQEIERDFRMMFKDKSIRFQRKLEEDGYRYEFPLFRLSMTVQPYWLTSDMTTPAVTKVTLGVLNDKNQALAQMIADSIDEMAVQRANGLAKA